MAQPNKPPKPKQPQDRVPTEPGFEKRLADTVKKALNTRPIHVPDKRTKANKDK